MKLVSTRAAFGPGPAEDTNTQRERDRDREREAYTHAQQDATRHGTLLDYNTCG